MNSLWSKINLISIYGPNKSDLEDVIDRYEYASKLHDLSMFVNLMKFITYAYKTLDYLEAEEYYGSWF